MIYSDELLAVAKRIFWFGTPEEALEFPKRFLTYAMTYASDKDIEILRKYFSDDDFRATLDDPAPGIFDRSSWTKWNERYNRTPVPVLSVQAQSQPEVYKHSAGWPGLLILRALPTQWVPRSFAFLRRNGSRKCRRQVGLITCQQQNQIASAASPPTPCKKREGCGIRLSIFGLPNDYLITER
jgi:hypothetical protein